MLLAGLATQRNQSVQQKLDELRADASSEQRVTADSNLISWGCGVKLGLVYAVNPRLSRYSMGLSDPRDILIRFALYHSI